MKDFIKMTLAVICGLFIIGIIGFFILAGVIGSVASTTSNKAVMPREGVLDMNMSKYVIAEQSKETFNIGAMTAGGSQNLPVIGIWDAIQAIDKAAEDPAVKYIYLRADNLTIGNTEVQELRNALAEFRKSGKAVIAYTESPSNGSYYLSSVADKIYMTSDHGGQNTMFGFCGRMIFLKDLLDKLGVDVQLIRHGKYKSAGEMFVRNESSPENMEQNQVMVDGLWKNFSSQMAQSRDMSEAQFNDLIDNLKLNFPEDFLANHLVDSLFTYDQLVSKLCDLAQVDNKDELHPIEFADYVKAKVVPNLKAKNKIAIIYADGEINDGDDEKDVAGDRFAKIIYNIRRDSTIKAVVFRVNSPGGSVIASAKIKDEIDLLRKDKPVVASYGDYAASGGYWISNSCDKIFSNSCTLTGSIGVFSMIPEFSKTAKNIAHVNITPVTSNKHSDALMLMRPFNAEELAYIQASIEDIYSQFVSTVSKGRNLKSEFVDSIAQGRVWVGSDAVKLGLVDEIGGIQDALHYAASMASSDNSTDLAGWQVEEYPKPLTIMEQIMSMFNEHKTDNSDNILSGTPFADLGKIFNDWRAGTMTPGVYARIPYDIQVK